MLLILQVCIVVCVVSLEDNDITPASVPYDQCREIRTEGIGTSHQLDYIIIPASAAIVATVIIAVIIFIACLKTSQKKRDGKVNMINRFINTVPLLFRFPFQIIYISYVCMQCFRQFKKKNLFIH